MATTIEISFFKIIMSLIWYLSGKLLLKVIKFSVADNIVISFTVILQKFRYKLDK